MLRQVERGQGRPDRTGRDVGTHLSVAPFKTQDGKSRHCFYPKATLEKS